MHKMSHTPAQRADWYAGKKVPQEDFVTWLYRVLTRTPNLRGAYTPRKFKRGIYYKALK